MDVLDTCGLFIFCPESSFRSRLSLGGETGNGPMISLRPWLITAHHSVSSRSDPGHEALPRTSYLRPFCDMDTTCSVRRSDRSTQGSERNIPSTPAPISRTDCQAVVHSKMRPSEQKEDSVTSESHYEGTSLTRTNRGQYSRASRATRQKSNELTT